MSSKTERHQGLFSSLGGFHDGAFQQVIDDLVAEFNLAFEGLVDAVLRPGLGQGFQFDVGGIAAYLFEISDDGFELIVVES